MRGCVCPHPPLLVPQIGGAAVAAVQRTVTAMRELAASVGEPETIVIVSPHTPSLSSRYTIKTAAQLSGNFAAFGHEEVGCQIANDDELTAALLAAAAASNVPLVPSDSPVLDHGVLVPLHFLRARHLVSLSVVADYGAHVALGELVRGCVSELERDVLFVASGDMSHRLTPDGPYGYDARGPQFDRRVVELLAQGDFAGLLAIDADLRHGASECGLRSLIALGAYLGADASREPHIYSYEGPYGVGYLVASFGILPQAA